MNSPRSGPDIRRIVVALDASASSLSSLEAAARLAARCRAELVGLFVEDENLLRLADLPFAREVQPSGATERPLAAAQVARSLRVQAERARRTLGRIAGELAISNSLEVVRGNYLAEALSATVELDVLFLRAGAAREASRIGRAARATGAARGRVGQRRVWVLYDASPGAARVLAMARDLAAGARADIVVVVPAPSAAAGDRLRSEAAALIGEAGSVSYATVPDVDPETIVRTVRGAALVVLKRDGSVRSDDRVRALLEALDCPVVVVG